MNSDKYSRNVSLACPTCGCTEFEFRETTEDQTYNCMGCRRTLSNDELVDRNAENIEAHVEEIGKEIVNDLIGNFGKTLSRNKNFKRS